MQCLLVRRELDLQWVGEWNSVPLFNSRADPLPLVKDVAVSLNCTGSSVFVLLTRYATASEALEMYACSTEVNMRPLH